MNKTVYLVEDDENIRELVCIALENTYNVHGFETAEECIEEMNNKIPDLILFDIMLPAMSGMDAVKIIRNNSRYNKVPIIMLTAKDSELDKIKGLDNGADDYITKPFSIMELMARIRSLFRRSDFSAESGNNENYLNFDELSINTDTREVFVDSKLVPLTFKEYELLVFIVRNRNRAVSRDEILTQVWEYEYMGETRTIDIHIKTIRDKLGKASRFIKTIRGLGYRFYVKQE